MQTWSKLEQASKKEGEGFLNKNEEEEREREVILELSLRGLMLMVWE